MRCLRLPCYHWYSASSTGERSIAISMSVSLSVCLSVCLSICLSVCLSHAYLGNHMSELHQIFWLGLALTALRYFVYTSGFVDDVMFSMMGPMAQATQYDVNLDWLTTGSTRLGRSLKSIIILVTWWTVGMGMCCEKKTMIAWRNVWSMKWRVPGQRAKRTWREIVQKDCQARKLNRQEAMDRSRWTKLIKDGWWSE